MRRTRTQALLLSVAGALLTLSLFASRAEAQCAICVGPPFEKRCYWGPVDEGFDGCDSDGQACYMTGGGICGGLASNLTPVGFVVVLARADASGPVAPAVFSDWLAQSATARGCHGFVTDVRYSAVEATRVRRELRTLAV